MSEEAEGHLALLTLKAEMKAMFSHNKRGPSGNGKTSF
jgi:hypothetical protein